MFDNDLELKSNRFRSRQILVERSVDDISKFAFTKKEKSSVAQIISLAFGDEGTYRFTIHLHDNIIKELVSLDIEPQVDRFLDNAQESFTQNPAKEGGCSLFGIIDKTSSSLISALHEPGFQLQVTSFQLVS